MSTLKEGTISQWYRGKSVFITGGTGFMGKVLVEKLLYGCPGIKTVYILMRSKRGRTPEQRLDDMFKLPMFNRLNASQPEARKKIKVVHGDVTTDNLGLSPAERQLLREHVAVIFHCAATLKLEAHLKDAIEMNTAGTDRVLDLAKEIKDLKAFIHLSTAFCSADIPEFKEKVYPSPDDPRDVIQCARWMREDALHIATPSLIAPHPNTYTYSKRLAETLVASEFPRLPAAIVRPSIVCPAWEEPVQGWVDNLNGPTGLLVAAGKGVLRSMHAKPELRAQTVPVDYAINGLIAIGWKTGSATERPKELPVYNMTADAVKKVTWGDILTKGRRVIYDYPFEMCIWYPDGDMRSSKFVHNLMVLLLHWLPAYFIDALLFIFRQKRFMIRVQTKISDGLELLQFFTTREWIFDSKMFLGLWAIMDPEDKKNFNFDFDALPEEEYMKRCIIGARVYCMKEPLSSLTYCRIKQKFLYVLHKGFIFFLYYLAIKFIITYSDTTKQVFDSAGAYVRDIPFIGSLVPAH